jgi:ABC-type transport system involved in multi-copper enzyme maturation permease subunit
MWTLIRKDLIFDRRVMIANFAFYLVFLPAYASLFEWVPPTVYAGFAAIVSAIFPLTLVGREDKFKTAALTCSLPVTRDAVVASRYLGGWLVAVSAVAALMAVGYIVPWTGYAQRGAEAPAAGLIAFVLIGLVIAGLFPFTLRFGIKGLIGFLVFTQVLGMVAFIGAATIGLDTIRMAIVGLRGALRGVAGLLGDGGLALLLVLAVVLLNLASFLVSRWIYRRREF